MAELLVSDFLHLSKSLPIIDVRSPGEYESGHIPGSYNIPLFNNEERAEVGTCFKTVGKKAAVKLGLKIVGPKMYGFVEQVEKRSLGDEVLVHCWRGGMRSGSFAWLLTTAGIKAHTLIKGYKGYRNFSLEKFQELDNLVLLGGETGSGKTEILNLLSKNGEQVIDLEKLANHKGSSFGNLSKYPQPSTEQFQNDLLERILSFNTKKRIWVEDESHNIGNVGIPDLFWKKMRSSPLIRIVKDKSHRISQLVNEYGKIDPNLLKEGILRIQKKLGGLITQQALESLEKGDMQKVAELCLMYYDKAYKSGLYNRDPNLIHNIEVTSDMSHGAILDSVRTIAVNQPQG